jgi:hypothetical protein
MNFINQNCLCAWKLLLWNNCIYATYILKIMYDSCLLNYESILFPCKVSNYIHDYEMFIYALFLGNHSFMLCWVQNIALNLFDI